MVDSKQFAVIGLGMFGKSVASALNEMGYEVLAIDADEEKVQDFSNVIPHVVQADTTDINSLKALGIRNFDVVIVAIGQNLQANILTTLLLNELGVANVVSKAQSEIHGKMLLKLGAARVVYPERDMGVRLAHSLVSSNVLEYIQLSPDLSIVEVSAPGSIVGKTLVEANLRARFEINVVAIKHGGELFVPPNPEKAINAGDTLFVVGRNKGVQAFEELK